MGGDDRRTSAAGCVPKADILDAKMRSGSECRLRHARDGLRIWWIELSVITRVQRWEKTECSRLRLGPVSTKAQRFKSLGAVTAKAPYRVRAGLQGGCVAVAIDSRLANGIASQLRSPLGASGCARGHGVFQVGTGV